jgi:hypothetical protein
MKRNKKYNGCEREGGGKKTQLVGNSDSFLQTKHCRGKTALPTSYFVLALLNALLPRFVLIEL